MSHLDHSERFRTFRKPELHAMGFKALLDIGEEDLGKPAIDRLVAELGLTTDELRDATAWYSVALAEALTQRLMERTGDPQLIRRVAARILTPRYLGPLYPLYRAVGTPLRIYKQIDAIVRRSNNTGRWQVERAAQGDVLLAYRPHPSTTPEATHCMCQMRLAQLEGGTTLFDLPPATVEHPECLRRGDARCLYAVRWTEPVHSIASKLALIAGAALAMTLVGSGRAQGGLVYFALGATTLALWALARMAELHSRLRDRVHDLGEYRGALTRSEEDAEKRYSELLEAKAEVENKVELRTTELRETSQRLEQALLEVQAVDRAKTDFFNNVSHELRTPLTLILAPIDALVAGREPAGGTAHALDAMRRNAHRLLKLINQLLDFAKLDAGEMRLSRRLVDFSQITRSVQDAFGPALEARRVLLSVELDPNLAPIAIDPSWMESVMTNIVANAARLVPEGGRISVRVHDASTAMTVEISDDGPGMSAGDAARVFDRFAQAGDSRTGRVGTGLGMAIVREAVRLHGGDISVRTAPGSGATFIIRVPRIYEPVRAAEPAHDGATSSRLDELPALPPRETLRSERPGPPDAPLALVVEDDQDLRRHIADVLAGRYRVVTARDGEEGLAKARELRPHVVISDVAMPKLDGVSLCRALRMSDETRDIPCLLVTARSNVTHVVEGFEAGASDYLLKPFHATELLARVDVHVRLRRLMREVARHERLAAVGSLAASVAHHVRNPLSALMAGLPAMRARLGAAIDPATGELMSVMLDCAVRIERLTRDLLDLSRVDREARGTLQPGVGLLACARILSARTVATIQMHTDVDDKAEIIGRAGDLNHVFLNLIDNALRAVGDAGSISVRGTIEDDSYLVCIGDSGNGVDAVLSNRVFEPFWTTRPAGEGTGLGLSIAKEIVGEHGGTIEVGRSPLGGAEFIVRLPLPRQAASSDPRLRLPPPPKLSAIAELRNPGC